MQTPTWFKLASCLVFVNAGLVSLISLAPGDQPPKHTKQAGDDSNEDTSPKNTGETNETKTAANDGVKPSTQGQPQDEVVADTADRMPNLPPLANVQSTLPDVPSLSLPAEDYRSNPVFQEIEKMLSQQPGLDMQEPSEEAPPTPMVKISEAYCTQLAGRLDTVMHLCKSAKGLVEEAAGLAQAGDLQGSRELLGIATQLRETAAALLVREL